MQMYIYNNNRGDEDRRLQTNISPSTCIAPQAHGLILYATVPSCTRARNNSPMQQREMVSTLHQTFVIAWSRLGPFLGTLSHARLSTNRAGIAESPESYRGAGDLEASITTSRASLIDETVVLGNPHRILHRLASEVETSIAVKTVDSLKLKNSRHE
jgi:hypothetical protein